MNLPVQTSDPNVRAEEGPPRTTRKSRVVRAVKWTVVGFAAQKMAQLSASIAVAYLLDPALLGRMEIIWTVLTGLQLLSDVGAGPNIVQSDRGDDDDFLNTAWTIQVVRGFVLFAILAAVSWPICAAFDRPDMQLPLLVTGLTSVISGFDSISMHTEKRAINLGSIVRLEFIASLTGISTMVGLAFVSKTVWPLVFGGVVTAFVGTVGSHLLLKKHKHRLHIERSAMVEQFRFGRWVFLSTACSYAATHIDKLVFGYISERALGVYSRAGRFNDAAGGLMYNMTHNLLFPLLSEARREDPSSLLRTYSKARLRIEALFATVAGGFLGYGQAFIELIYPESFHGAGPYLMLMSIPLGMSTGLTSSEMLLTSAGQSQFSFIRSLTMMLWMAVAMPYGYQEAGLWGVAVAVATGYVPVTAVMWIGLMQRGLFNIWIELRPILFYAFGALLGVAATWLTHLAFGT